ncbi:MAG: type VI secretion system baseplate subunit TssF, partial [Desulfobulbaceae bacterium]|nr:type VI secretion system baseplate subunit TssF [Desulfobulbaceae bacterium]
QAIKSRSTDRIFRGVPKRGGQTTITIDQACFPCEGAMYLFGSALNEFLSMYATANNFHYLIVREASRGEEYRWPARLGGGGHR